MVMVTHDLGDAAVLGDEVILLRAGRIVQRGPLAELVHRPADPFVTQFIEAQRAPIEALARMRRALPWCALAALVAACLPRSGRRRRRLEEVHRVGDPRRADHAPARRRRRARAPPGAARRHARLVGRAASPAHIDVYPEYTGTLCQEILHSACDEATLRRALAERSLGMTRVARLRRRLRAGGARRAGRRGCTWPASPIWRRIPSCASASPRSSWRAATAGPRCARATACRRPTCAASTTISPGAASTRGTLDVIDAYATDAEIALLPAAPARRRSALLHRVPGGAALPSAARRQRVGAALGRLVGAIPAADMIAMNARAKLDKVPEARVAADFLAARFGVASERRRRTASGGASADARSSTSRWSASRSPAPCSSACRSASWPRAAAGSASSSSA